LGFEKSQRSVTHDYLRYVNILTYLLTNILSVRSINNVSGFVGAIAFTKYRVGQKETDHFQMHHFQKCITLVYG